MNFGFKQTSNQILTFLTNKCLEANRKHTIYFPGLQERMKLVTKCLIITRQSISVPFFQLNKTNHSFNLVNNLYTKQEF